MQLLTHVQRESSTAAASALLIPLSQATQPADSTREAQDVQEQRAARRKKRHQEDSQRDAQRADQLNPGAAALAHAAEREMRPGSRSLARDQARGEAFRRQWRQVSESNAHTAPSATQQTVRSQQPAEPATTGVVPPRQTAATTVAAPNAELAQARAAQPVQTPEIGTSGGPSVASQSNSRSSVVTAQIADVPVSPHRAASGVLNTTSPPAAIASAAASQVKGAHAAGLNEPRSASPALRAVDTSVMQIRLGSSSPASTPSARAATPPEATGRNESLTEQLVRVARSRLNEKHTIATLRLDPPALGSVRMHMDLREDRLLLRIEPQSELAHRLLSEQTDALRGALEAAGIRLLRVEVVFPQEGTEAARFGQMENFGTDGNHPNDPRRDAADSSAQRPEEENRDTDVSRPTTAEIIPVIVPGHGGLLTRVNLWA